MNKAADEPSAQALLEASLLDCRADVNYVALVVGSASIATFGLLENSAAVIIGAMIIAPLIQPIQGIAFSALAGRGAALRRSVATLAIGALLAIAVAFLLDFGAGFTIFGSEVAARDKPTLLDLAIAIAAGAITGFAKVRPAVSNTIAGTAIAVALMPPLCVIGLGIAHHAMSVATGAALLFGTNLVGITLSCMIVYRLAGHGTSAQARAPMGAAVVLAALLAIPLAASLEELLRQSALQSALQRALAQQTVTFRHAQLVQTSFDWSQHPPRATLVVRSPRPISPHQVELLETFARRATGTQFRLVFLVSRVEVVTAGGVTAPAGISDTPSP